MHGKRFCRPPAWPVTWARGASWHGLPWDSVAGTNGPGQVTTRSSCHYCRTLSRSSAAQMMRLRVRLLTRLACAWRSDPKRRDDSAALSREAIDIARRLGEPATLSYALAGRFWATWWPENPEERQQIEREMMVIAQAVGDGERIIEAHLMRFMSLIELGQMTDARQESVTLSRAVEELRQPAQMWLEPVNRSVLALIEGDYGLAETLVARQLATGYRVTAGKDDVSAARMHRFLLRREQGRLAEEEASVRESARDFPWYPMHRAALVCLLIDLDRSAEARAAFDDLAMDDFEAIYRDNEWLLGMCMASEASARLGDVAAARVLYGQLLPIRGTTCDRSRGGKRRRG